MSYFDRLLHFYSLIIDEAYELEADFDKNKARALRKSIVQRDIQVTKFIHDYETSLELLTFNQSTLTEETIKAQLQVMKQIAIFNNTVLKINVVSKTGYYMFIKDIIAYSHLLP